MLFYDIDKHVNKVLNTLDSTKYFVINDFLLRHNNTSYVIKHLVISPYGVFIIDTLDIKDGVIGNLKEHSWVLENGKYIDNPILKTYDLIIYLDEYLHLRDEYYTYILSVKDKSLCTINGSFNLINIEDIPPFILKNTLEVIPNYEVIYKSLLDNTYVNNNKISSAMEEGNMKCPICGRGLVERQNSTGSYYSCLNYPRCNYIKDKNE